MSTIEIVLLGMCAGLTIALYLVWSHALELQRVNKKLRDALASGQTKRAIKLMEETRRGAIVEDRLSESLTAAIHEAQKDFVRNHQVDVENLPAFLRKQAD